MKKLNLIIIICLMLNIVTASICEDRTDKNKNCTMLTPSLSCTTYNYDIINLTDGVIIKDDYNLSIVNNSIYYFNFSQDEGDYIVQLCDNSTREIRVTSTLDKQIGGGNMIMGIAILLGIITLGIFYLIAQTKTIEFKVMWGLVALLFVVVDLWFAYNFVLYTDSATAGMATSMLAIYEIALVILQWLFGLVVVAVLFIAVFAIVNQFKVRKLRKESPEMFFK